MTEWIAMIVLGLLLILMGVLNLRGDLSSIHWYNRRKVAAEHRSAYGRCMGAGSAAIGGGLLLTGLLQLARPMEARYFGRRTAIKRNLLFLAAALVTSLLVGGVMAW